MTTSAFACTIDSGSFDNRKSGAIFLTSAETDDRSPTSMLGSTAKTAGSSAKSGGVTTSMSTGSTAAGTPGITVNWFLKKGKHFGKL